MISIFFGVFGFTKEKKLLFTPFLHTNKSKIDIKLLRDFKQKIPKTGCLFYTFTLEKKSILRHDYSEINLKYI